MAELEEMEQEQLDAELLDVTPAPQDTLPNLPTPSSQIPTSSKAQEEDDEMAELEQWAS